MKCELIGFASQAYTSGEPYSAKNKLGITGEVCVMDNHEVHRYGDFRIPISEEFFNHIGKRFQPNQNPKLKITVETIE